MSRGLAPIAGAALLAALAAAPAAHAAFPGRNGHIVYERFSLMSDELSGSEHSEYSLKAADLRSPNRFTLRSCMTVDQVPQDPECGTRYEDPAYSPSGDVLVVDAGTQLAVMGSDGSNFRLLPAQTSDDGEPAWSPDGKRIAFTGPSASGAPRRDLYVLNLARGTSRRITTNGARFPAWSNRNRIAYVVGYSDRVGAPPSGQIATIAPNGGLQRRLTRKGGVAPAWSPHGTKIAFVRRFHLYVMDARGGNLRRVGGRRPVEADDVAWSPDGRRFAFHDFESGFFVVRTDGTGERQIDTGGSGSDYSFDSYSPDWQPLPTRRVSSLST